METYVLVESYATGERRERTYGKLQDAVTAMRYMAAALGLRISDGSHKARVTYEGRHSLRVEAPSGAVAARFGIEGSDREDF